MTSPSADLSVRVAWTEDAEAVGAVQARAWREEYAGTLPSDVLAALEPAALAERWRQALQRPGDARNRVLVALERNVVRGFAVTTPSPDGDADAVSDGEIGEIVVDPDHRGRGHGSRLLQACVDTLRADRFTRATCWVSSGDDVRRAFLASAGWATDGAHRELDLAGDGEVRVKQVRLHTDIREVEPGN
jgi:ribosomal protein S18 acetylase RimI-like enzyme